MLQRSLFIKCVNFHLVDRLFQHAYAEHSCFSVIEKETQRLEDFKNWEQLYVMNILIATSLVLGILNTTICYL